MLRYVMLLPDVFLVEACASSMDGSEYVPRVPHLPELNPTIVESLAVVKLAPLWQGSTPF
jgi:hypothetical protein